ncbi:MAG: phage tail protein [Plesiomonas sp.]
MAKYFAILTNLGAGKLANAAALGTKLEMTHIAVGDGGGVSAPEPTPDPAMTDLLGEKRRAAINSLSIDPLNPNQIIVEQVIPETDGGFWIREIGLFDKAGTLIAYSNCAGSYKPQLQEGSGRALVIRMLLIVSSTAAVSLKIDPSVVLATRKYVDDNVIEVRAYADQLMRTHVADVHPHKQYAKVANAPVSLNDLQKIAAAINNNSNFAADVITELSRKLAKDQHGADIQDKELFRRNIGLKSASTHEVGNGVGQIPNMNFFGYSMPSARTSGYHKLPSGLMLQWMYIEAPKHISTETPSTIDGYFTIPFTTICYGVMPFFIGYTASPSGLAFLSGAPMTLSTYRIANSYGLSELSCLVLAIGY